MTESETGGPELYFPALGGVYEKLTPYTWPLVRVTVGLMQVPHGWMKLIGGGLEGTARFMAQIGLEPAYPLALYIALLELVLDDHDGFVGHRAASSSASCLVWPFLNPRCESRMKGM